MKRLLACLLWVLSLAPAHAGETKQWLKACGYAVVFNWSREREIVQKIREDRVALALDDAGARPGQPTDAHGDGNRLRTRWWAPHTEDLRRFRRSTGEINGLSAQKHSNEIQEHIRKLSLSPELGRVEPYKKYAGLVLPDDKKLRSTEEIEAWFTFLKKEMESPDFTVEQMFGIIDAGFSSGGFKYAALADLANIKSIKFVGKHNVVLRNIFGGFMKPKATLATPTDKAPESHLQVYGDIPKDPEDMSIWLTELTKTLHKGVGKRLGEQPIVLASNSGLRPGMNHLDDVMMPTADILRGGTANIYAELQSYLDMKWKQQGSPVLDESGQVIGYSQWTSNHDKSKPKELPLKKPSLWRAPAYMAELWFHTKAVTKGVFTWKPFGPATDLFELIFDPARVESPAYLEPTRDEVDLIIAKRKAIQGELHDADPENARGLQRALAESDQLLSERLHTKHTSMRRTMLSYYVHRETSKWGNRVWNGIVISTMAGLGYGYFAHSEIARDTVDKGKAKSVQVAGKLNRQITTTIGQDKQKVMEDYNALYAKWEALTATAEKMRTAPDANSPEKKAALEKTKLEIEADASKLEDLWGMIEGSPKEDE